jgi:Subtilisin-like serine proteases
MNMNWVVRSSGVIFLLFFYFSSFAQKAIPKDWFLKDPEKDSVQGVSVEKTYQTLLKDKPSKAIIVAVIDSGVDAEHEDLKNVMWVNEDEIPNNGIDDDKNGYVDDIHGWNFIGGKNGNVNEDSYELTREFVRLNATYGSLTENQVSKKQKSEYESFLKIKDKYQKLLEKNNQQYQLYSKIYDNFSVSVDTLKALLKTEKITPEALRNFETKDPQLLFAKGFILNMFRNIGDDADLDDYLAQLKEASDYYGVIVKYGYNTDFDSRKIVGDNYKDPYEKYYGNNDVKGPDASHGTHVAGIIAADRNNNVGINGIANNARIMSVRAVPNGDERDKDVANAIIYAVDNGARIINMSFGKSFSPEKEVVDKAVKYAEQKGVLLVHAAGNDSENTDVTVNYPNRYFKDGKEAKNWIEVGASAWGNDASFVGEFSNYGKKTVSLFAPGVEIYSTVPDNGYKNMDGTSMASPSTAGVAALVMSYFPELTAMQVKDILMKSSRKFDNLKVQKPGSADQIEFSELSQSGGLVNAYEAVRMALEITKSKVSLQK